MLIKNEIFKFREDITIMETELKQLIGKNETILYEGKPDRNCFLFESIFNPMLPFAVVWALFDLGFIKNSFDVGNMNMVILPFMLFHMMPVWIYLSGMVFTFRRYRNTYYIVTDHAVYVSGGTFTKNMQCKPFAKLSQVNLHRGIFDQMFHTGDIHLTTDQMTKNNIAAVIGINSISDYMDVYQIVKKLQRDIYSDMMYPNDLRPTENHGYKTKYKG